MCVCWGTGVKNKEEKTKRVKSKSLVPGQWLWSSLLWSLLFLKIYMCIRKVFQHIYIGIGHWKILILQKDQFSLTFVKKYRLVFCFTLGTEKTISLQLTWLWKDPMGYTLHYVCLQTNPALQPNYLNSITPLVWWRRFPNRSCHPLVQLFNCMTFILL